MLCVYGHMYVCRAFVCMYVSRAFVHDVCMPCVHTCTCMLFVYVYAHAYVRMCVRAYVSMSHIRAFVGMPCVNVYLYTKKIHQTGHCE